MMYTESRSTDESADRSSTASSDEKKFFRGKAKKVLATYAKCGGERGGAGEKVKSWIGGAWSLVRKRACGKNGKAPTRIATGREMGTLCKAGGESTRLRGRRVRNLMWESSWDEVSSGAPWPWWCSP
jgi:hypothetical protein